MCQHTLSSPQMGSREDRIYAGLTATLAVERLFPLDLRLKEKRYKAVPNKK